jgi:hypothetical protein
VPRRLRLAWQLRPRPRTPCPGAARGPRARAASTRPPPPCGRAKRRPRTGRPSRSLPRRRSMAKPPPRGWTCHRFHRLPAQRAPWGNASGAEAALHGCASATPPAWLPWRLAHRHRPPAIMGESGGATHAPQQGGARANVRICGLGHLTTGHLQSLSGNCAPPATCPSLNVTAHVPPCMGLHNARQPWVLATWWAAMHGPGAAASCRGRGRGFGVCALGPLPSAGLLPRDPPKGGICRPHRRHGAASLARTGRPKALPPGASPPPPDKMPGAAHPFGDVGCPEEDQVASPRPRSQERSPLPTLTRKQAGPPTARRTTPGRHT